jgi:outer membrane scaffolding protein for murein synthesis (MipA/OmpV family)
LPPRADAPRSTGSLYQGLTKSDSPYGWLVTVNVKGVVSPKYTGSNSYAFVGFPTLSFRRPGMPEKWSSPDDSISLNLYENDRLAIGPALSYRGGRYTKDAPELAGIHKPKWTLEGGVFADLWLAPDKMRLRGELRHGMRNGDGFNGSLGADYVMRFGQLTVGLGPRMKWGDAEFMRNQFGVSQADTMANPRFAAYKPGGGVYALGAYGSANYKQNEHWSYTVHGGYDRLRGQAGASPIVKAASGSRDQWSIGAIISYTFGVGVAGR